MQSTYPDYNFPSYPHATSTRQMFSFCGPGFVNTDGAGRFESRRVQPHKTLQSVHPTIPLSNIPAEVPYPWKDRVMGEMIEKNKILSSFIPGVTAQNSMGKRSAKRKEVEELLNTIEEYKDTPDDGDVVTGMMQPWFTELLQKYERIKDVREPQTHNSVYAGGCLVCFQGDDDSQSLMVAPSGSNFDVINLYSVAEDSKGIVRSKVIGKETLPGSIYEVRGQQLHSQKQILVRLDTSCLIYAIEDVNEDKVFTLKQKTDVSTGIPTSVSFSPYIPDECVIATDQGRCYLWTENSCVEMIEAHRPRFPTLDTWRSSHFGAHPRQIIFSDPTMVQTFDLREPMSTGDDLFALPNHLLHEKERIRQCQNFQKVPFYQIIATDYNLMLVDERFPGHVVLKWDHMLSTPPQYISVLDRLPDSEDSVVYIGSQVPSEVHGFQFRIRGDKPPQSVSLPFRVDRMRDILKNPTVTENISHVTALEERFNSSLIGLQVLPWRSGHMVFQLDSHGEIFGQLFEETEPDTFLQETESSALMHAKDWVEALESQLRHCVKTSGRTVVKDVSHKFDEIQSTQPVCTSCSLCIPSSSEEHEAVDQEDAFCLRCMQSVKDSRELVEAVDKDSIKPSSVSCNLPRRCGLVDADKFPSTSALSRLLLKQWNKDTDIDNELKDWDKEVLEKRKQRRKKKVEQQSVAIETSSSTQQLQRTDNALTVQVTMETDILSHGTAESEERLQEQVSDTSGDEENIPSNKEIEDTSTNQGAKNTSASQELEKAASSQDTVNKRTSVTPVVSLRNTVSGGALPSSSVGMYDSDESLFSDLEQASPRTRRRHASVSSLVSVRSDISRVSVTSFPGFLDSPKHLRARQNDETSPTVNRNTPGVTKSINLNDNPESIRRDCSNKLSTSDVEFSLFKPPSLFGSPVSASRSPVKPHSGSPKSRLWLSPSKVRKKSTYQPGF